MKSFVEASIAVEKYLLSNGPDLEIHSVKVLPKFIGWVFSYSSKKFLRTGNPLDGVAGNSPIIYDRNNGTLHVTGTAYPVEHYIDEFIILNNY